jgi:hypothetical protein
MGTARQLELTLPDQGAHAEQVPMRPGLMRCEVCKVLAAELFPILTSYGFKNVCGKLGCAGA